MDDAKYIRALALHVLNNATKHDWSLQGFGMLRTYLPGDMRMNVWDGRYRIPDVSVIHTHPWHFESLVVSGELENVRYRICRTGWAYHHARIKPGPRGGIMDRLGDVRLEPAASPEIVSAGSTYFQAADEIHESRPCAGCVTINARTRIGPDEALVYWPEGTEWVSAEPRPATEAEVLSITRLAVKRFEHQ